MSRPAEDRSVELAAFFATLVREVDAVGEIVRRSAERLGVGVGVVYEDGTALAFGPLGTALAGDAPEDALRCPIPGGSVWMDGDGEAALAGLAVAVSVADRNPRISHLVSPFVDLITGTAGDDKSSSLAALRLRRAQPIRIVAAAGDHAARVRFRRRLAERNRVVATAELDALTVYLVDCDGTELVLIGPPVGVQAAASPVFEAYRIPEAVKSARTMMRFSRPADRERPDYESGENTFIDGAQVGALGWVAEYFEPHHAERISDIVLLDELFASAPPEIPMMLEVVAATDSIRAAGRRMLVHHNSVQHWVRRAEDRLGYVITDPYFRGRLLLALIMRRLRDNYGTF